MSYKDNREKYRNRVMLNRTIVIDQDSKQTFDNIKANKLFSTYLKIIEKNRLPILEVYECIKLEKDTNLRMYLVNRIGSAIRSRRRLKAFFSDNPQYSKE